MVRLNYYESNGCLGTLIQLNRHT